MLALFEGPIKDTPPLKLKDEFDPRLAFSKDVVDPYDLYCRHLCRSCSIYIDPNYQLMLA